MTRCFRSCGGLRWRRGCDRRIKSAWRGPLARGEGGERGRVEPAREQGPDGYVCAQRAADRAGEGGAQRLGEHEGAQHALVFNGEVYNYEALRDELAHRWHFRTQSDSEVVLAALVR